MPVHDQDIVTEFQRRKALSWQKLRYWVLFLALVFPGTILTLVIASALRVEKDALVLLAVGMMLPLGVAIVFVNLTLKRYYLCPACERVPFRGGNAGGVIIDPGECPHCGARLK